MHTFKPAFKRLALGLATLIGLLAAAGLVYESVSERITRRDFPPPGRLVDVGDYRLHLHVQGQPQDAPTIILEHGGVAMSSQWGWIQPALAQHTRVVAYDRPGMGWSDPAPDGLDAETAVAHLYAALQQEGIQGPYLLVGHSMGGLMVRLFAQMYPDEVAGLVLVDPRDVTPHELLTFGMDDGALLLVQTLSRLGVLRLSGVAAGDAAGLPPQQQAEAERILISSRQVSGWAAEGRLGDSAVERLADGEDLHHVPLMVLSAGQPDGAFDAAQRAVLAEQHRQITALSNQGVYRPVPGAGHVTIVTHQEYAQIVNDSILEMLSQN